MIAGTGLLVLSLANGLIWAFGVFFKPMASDLGWSRAVLSGAFGLTSAVSGLFAPVAGHLCDRFGVRRVVSTGGGLLSTGLLLMPLIGTVWQLYLIYGLLFGIGNSIIYIPFLSTVSRWFEKRRGLALGMVTAGSGLGAVYMPPLGTYLIGALGWRMTFFVLGLVMLVIIGTATLFLKSSPQEKGLLPYGGGPGPVGGGPGIPFPMPGNPAASPGFTLSQAACTSAFWWVTLAAFLSNYSLQVVSVHVVNFATDPGIAVSPAVAASLISIIGGVGIMAKLGVGFVSDHIGRKAALAISFSIGSFALLWLTASQAGWMLYVFAPLYGLAYGGWMPMFPVIAGELFGLASVGAVIGGVQAGMAVGSSLGSYASGIIFDLLSSYRLAFAIAAAGMVSALVLILLVRKPDILSYSSPDQV